MGTKASANSDRTNLPSRTRCPACGCDLTRSDGSHTEGSQQSSEFDVTDSCAFKPGGVFLDLEEGSDGMGKLKMGDCESPSHAATRTTPKSALRKVDEVDDLNIRDSQPVRRTGAD